tara:strand:- start:1271 stop:2056 length:786 start_codon:yes stop_codon:yes gene_type:complete
MKLCARRLVLTTVAWALTILPVASWGNPAFSDYPRTENIPPDTVQLYRISDNVWTHVTTHGFGKSIFPSNGLIVRDGESLLLIDTAWGQRGTERLLSVIENSIGSPVTRVISTHFHDDRVGGIHYLAEVGIDTFATPLTRELAQAAGNDVPEHDIEGLSEAGKLVSFGPVQIYYPGAAHSADNIVIYVPAAQLLFGGCAVHEASRKSAGNVADADLSEWPKSIQRIQQQFPEAKIIVPGHGVPKGIELLEHTITLVNSHAT